MALYAITLTDQSTDFVEGADAYQQEGPLTTFFALADDRRVIDSWSVRLASYRTSEISAIRRGRRSSGITDIGAGPASERSVPNGGIAIAG